MAAEILNTAEHTRITEAVRTAEARTSGEIYVVVSRQADDFRFVPVLWAALLALLVPWPLLFLTAWSTEAILAVQVTAFAATALLASAAPLRHRLVPAALAADASREKAQALFMAHGCHLTEQRTGVLIYVAVADRRVEIVADALINARVAQSDWDALADAVADAARRGALADGLVTAVQQAGILLAQHFPPQHRDKNELPDRVVVI